MKPKPKIYITHPDPSIEEIADMVGVSRQRMNELIALAAEINKSMAPHSPKSKRKPSARKTSNGTVNGRVPKHPV